MKNTPSSPTRPRREPVRTYCRQRRDQEFSNYYHEVLRLLKQHRVKDAPKRALDYALASGAPHYDVDFDYAYRTMCAIIYQNRMPVSGKVRRAQLEELAGKVKALMQAGLGVAPALEFVLEHSRASHFFISRSNLRAHLGHLLKPTRSYNLNSL